MSAKPRQIPQSCFSPRLRLLLVQRAARLATRSGTEQGLSLIECLVAMIIIAITVVAITPPIMLATGTRIHIRRADQANQVAQAEVDRVRAIVELEADKLLVSKLPPTAPAGTTNLKTVAAATPSNTPSATSPLLSRNRSCGNLYPDNNVAINQVVLVDTNADCTPEFMMQVFRTVGTATELRDSANTPIPYSFDVGVRVYAWFPGQAAGLTLLPDRAKLTTSVGPRDRVNNTQKPLATLYSTIVRSNSSKALGTLCRGLTTNTAQCK